MAPNLLVRVCVTESILAPWRASALFRQADSEGIGMDNTKMTVALLGVVAVLLAVIAGILIFKAPSSAVVATDTSATAADANGASANAAAQAPPGMTQTTPVSDPAKATKVPGGQTPKAFVEAYFKAIMSKDFKAAYNMLPADKKASQTADQYGQTLAGYGFTGYTMGAEQDAGDKATVSATAKTGSGDFPYSFTFQKYNGGWVLMARTLQGMGQ